MHKQQLVLAGMLLFILTFVKRTFHNHESVEMSEGPA